MEYLDTPTCTAEFKKEGDAYDRKLLMERTMEARIWKATENGNDDQVLLITAYFHPSPSHSCTVLLRFPHPWIALVLATSLFL